MPTRHEKGGILLELFIATFILVTFTAGAARIHAAFRSRFERIVQERNEAIRAIRR